MSIKRGTPETDRPFAQSAMFVTISSFIAPIGGIATAPLLARALGVDGRGELAAAVAPATLMLGIATLGLPEALTFMIAKNPDSVRKIVLWCSFITLLLGCVFLGLSALAVPYISAGDSRLGAYMLLGACITIAALLTGLLRGAATGLQLYGHVATERVINAAAKVGGLALLFALGNLDVLSAVLVSCAAPVVAGAVYLRPVLVRNWISGSQTSTTASMRATISFGTRVWLGSIAGVLLARSNQLIIAPLSSVQDLGLYVVAVTVSDIVWIASTAIAGLLFGTNSKSLDSSRSATMSRYTLILSIFGSLLIGVSLPYWLGPLFGAEFTGAVGPTVILLASACLAIPGLMAASVLSAVGRPGLRSITVLATLAINLGATVGLVPIFGVYGATWATFLGTLANTALTLALCRKVAKMPIRPYFAVGIRDFRSLQTFLVGSIKIMR